VNPLLIMCVNLELMLTVTKPKGFSITYLFWIFELKILAYLII